MNELAIIYQSGYMDLSTGEYIVEFYSPFLLALSYLLIIGFSLIAFWFFFRIWK
jgi:hypothetical protein